MGAFIRQFWPYLFVALVLHAALVAFLVVNLERTSPLVAGDEPAPEAIEATVVDEALVEAELERIQEQERQRQQAVEDARREAERAAQQREAEERRLQELREQRERDAREAEQRRQRQEREAAERAQAEQQRIERLARERAEAERQAEEARRQREAEAERARQAEEERRRVEEEEAERRRQAEARAEEERRRAARQAEQQQQYIADIRDAVERNWRRPANWPSGTSCTVRVSQIPGGEVVEARITESCGDPMRDRSVEDAVLRASPLPRPPAPEVFSREIEFVFRPRT